MILHDAHCCFLLHHAVEEKLITDHMIPDLLVQMRYEMALAQNHGVVSEAAAFARHPSQQLVPIDETIEPRLTTILAAARRYIEVLTRWHLSILPPAAHIVHQLIEIIANEINEIEGSNLTPNEIYEDMTTATERAVTMNITDPAGLR